MIKRASKVSSGTRTSLYNLRKSESVVSLTFQNCDISEDIVCDIERIITRICAFHYAIASMQSRVSNFATLICMAETDGRVGDQR